MANLPTPGGDAGTWGDILNEFLLVAHNADGTLNTSAVSTALPSPIPTTNLGSGTASSSNFLRGDGTWATPASAANATTSAPGIIQLGGDLDGSGTTATTPTLANTSNVQSVVNTIIGNNATVSGALQKSTATTKGDLLAATGSSTITRLGVGSDGQVLTANSGQSAGLQWSSVSASSLGAAQALIPTAVKTSAYSANPGDFIPVDASGGSVTITLPTAPADRSRIAVKMINTASSNTTTIAAGGTDVFNKASGSTTETLTLLNQGVMLQYEASGDTGNSTGLWYVQSDDLALSQLDGRYLPTSGYTNVVYLKPSGDTTGATDSANLSGFCAVGAQEIVLGAGVFYVGGSSGVTLATGNWLHGAGTGATIVTIASGFTGAAVFNFPSGGYARISDISIVGASSTITSNPACNGIEGGVGRFCRVDNVFFQYINGWCGEDVDAGSSAAYASIWSNISGLNCAGGIHLKGVTGANWGQQQFLSNINFQQIGVGSGTNANLDVFRFEDSWDIVAMNFNASISDASTGSTVNIIGKCASLYFTNMDLGCYLNGTSMTNACIQIQDGSNGSPADIRFVQGEAQQGLNGLLISGGGATVHFNEFRFFNNYGSGVNLTGTGSEINFLSCTFSNNGQGGSANSGTYYDLQVTNSATGEARFCRYTTAIVSVGTNGVQMPVALPSAGYTFYHHFCTFVGSGTPSIPFTHVPGLYSRADTVPPQWNGRMNVTSGQSSNSGFQAQNSASSPTVPFSQFIAKSAGDQTAGVFVSGDSIPRLLVDSNGKHSWGPGGSSSTDTDLYRASSGVLQTDNNLTVGGISTGEVITASGLTGVTSASRYVGATTSGAPTTTSTTFAVGDFVIDRTGAIWICTTAGAPGTWASVDGGGGASAPLSLSAAESAGGVLAVTNTTSSPTSPSTKLFAKAAGDSTLGIEVTGDTDYRFTIDSNGKHQWGSGSANQDTDLYRSSAGVLQTDDAFTATGAITANGGVVMGSSASLDMASGQAFGMPTPATNGLIAWNGDPMTANNSQAGTSQTLYLMRFDVTRSVTMSKIWYTVSSTGASGVTFADAGVFNSSGTLLTSAVSISGSLGSNSLYNIAYSASLTPGYYWVGILIEASTMPTLGRLSSLLAIIGNVNLSASNARFAYNGTGLTSFPSSITPSSNQYTTNTVAWWIGIS
jgi:hypothetical protein